MQDLIKDIIQSLKEFRNPERAEWSKTYYPTKMQVIGVLVPDEKKILKELKLITKSYTGREKIEIARQLVNTNIFECQHIAYEYIGKDKTALKALEEKDISSLAKNLDNWISVDSFSIYILGYAWRENIITTATIKSYLKSEDFWVRRMAIVSTVSLNQKARGGTGDAARTLEICELAIHDHHDMINKALSWALRELSKADRIPVEEFMERHRVSLHTRVLREVHKKLETGRKNG